MHNISIPHGKIAIVIASEIHRKISWLNNIFHSLIFLSHSLMISIIIIDLLDWKKMPIEVAIIAAHSMYY